MLTRIEIDGFKTFENFSLDLRPLTAIVGPNASGKSNLFDALRFLSRLAQDDVRTAMQDMRGEPEELFRMTPAGNSDSMTFAVEVFISKRGVDAVGKKYEIKAQRLRYEVKLQLVKNSEGTPKSVFIRHERCIPIDSGKKHDKLFDGQKISYKTKLPFIDLNETKDAIKLRQDGPNKHGNPVTIPLSHTSRTALSTITTSEFPHLYALRSVLMNLRFLEIVPKAARAVNDRFENTVMKPDASNLASVLVHLKETTKSPDRPNGVLSEIVADLAFLIPSVSTLEVHDDPKQRQFSFSLGFSGQQLFSSRVISDGTLRLLALLAILNDPNRKGTLCFEEPENGIHEGRVPMLVDLLRNAAQISFEDDQPSFQILLNSHSPIVMAALKDDELVSAESVVTIDPKKHSRSTQTRMRVYSEPGNLFNPEKHLTRSEIKRLLQMPSDAA